jgi:hypothetical protein
MWVLSIAPIGTPPLNSAIADPSTPHHPLSRALKPTHTSARFAAEQLTLALYLTFAREQASPSCRVLFGDLFFALDLFERVEG